MGGQAGAEGRHVGARHTANALGALAAAGLGLGSHCVVWWVVVVGGWKAEQTQQRLQKDRVAERRWRRKPGWWMRGVVSLRMDRSPALGRSDGIANLYAVRVVLGLMS